MKIVFTGGGTGGHFYPIIAVAESLQTIMANGGLLPPKLYYIAPDPFDARALFEHNIEYIPAPSGKIRRYASIWNVIDSFKIAAGIIKTTLLLFKLYPDLVFSKGGYASIPTVFAARLLRIPVFIHDSDVLLGRANAWASSFAARIAISYPETADRISYKDKVAYTGNPIRPSIAKPAVEGAFEFLELARDIPTILILGGSQGSMRINDVVLEALPLLLERFQIIHQTGEKNFDDIKGTASIALENHPYKGRYKPFPYLNETALRMAVGASRLIVSRAGSTIFEIAAWAKPAILIPIPETVTHSQHENAFAYARAGGAVVIEEVNLTPHVLTAEIERLAFNPELCAEMSTAATAFTKLDAADTIAKEIIRLALRHEE